MKHCKKIIFIVIFLFVLVLVSCKPKDTTPPILKLDEVLLEIETDKPYNFYDIVYATDNVDGEIPVENIILESIGWTFDSGIYTPIAEDIGFHTVKYSVRDKAGNQAEPVYVDVNVVKGWTNRELIKQYDFQQVDMNGWDAQLSNSKGTFNAYKKSLKLSITDNKALKAEDIVVFKEGKETLQKNVKYSFAMKVKSSINIDTIFYVRDSEEKLIYEESIAIHTSEQSYTCNIVPTEETEGYTYEFLLGQNSKNFEVLFDQISLSYNMESYKPLISDLSSDYKEKTSPYSAYNHTELASDAENRYMTWEDNCVSLNIKFGCYNAWNSGIQRKVDTSLKKGKSYLVEFDISSESTDYRFELNFGLQDALTDMDCHKLSEKPSDFVKAHETLRFSRKITSDIDLDLFSVYIKNYSLEPGNLGTSKVTVKNFKFTEINGSQATYEEEFKPIDFATWNFGGGEGSLYCEDGNLVYEITKFGPEDKNNKLAIANFNAIEGKLYTVTFTGYASSDISCVIFFSEVDNWDKGQPINSTASFTTRAREFTFTATFPITSSATYEFLWQFGGIYGKPESCKITFTSIAIWAQE